MGEAKSGRAHRVLIVDDDADWREAAVLALEVAGVSADGVADGDAALRALAAGDYDGAVVDVHMPGRDGVSVVRALRESHGDGLALLIATAAPAATGVCAGLLAGADEEHFKTDPCEQLVGKLEHAWRTRESAALAG
jgi:DNA-binding response OmpR family regulator